MNVKKKIVFLCCLWCGLTVRSVLAMDPEAPGHLKGYIHLADNPKFIDAWSKWPSHAPVKTVDHFTYGQTMHIAFIVTGYSLNDESKMDVAVDYKVIAPSGSTLFDEKDYASARGRMEPKPGFVAANPALVLMPDEDQEVGCYKIQATFRDLVSKTEAQTETEFWLKPWDPELVLNQKKNFSVEEAEKFLQAGEYKKAAWYALSLYPADKKTALRIGQALKEKIKSPIQDFLFAVYQEFIGADPSVRIKGRLIAREWLHQKAAWCDLFITKVSKEQLPNTEVLGSKPSSE